MLHRLSLQHVGPAARLDIEFSSRVNLITGDNGLGKSFVLDIAWWALTRTWAHYPARPDGDAEVMPTISFAYGAGPGDEVAHTSRFDRRRQSWSIAPPDAPDPGLVIYAQVDGSFAVWDPARNGGRTPAYLFSPTDIWDGLSRADPRDASRSEVLCNGLIRDWAFWQKERGETYGQLCRVLAGLSSEGESLTPGALTRISLDDVRDMPTLRTPYGREVAIVHASAAVRRIAALAYLLVWSWHEHVLASKLLSRRPVGQIVFLIDEMEAHLHPAWQRRILRSIMDVVKALIGIAVQVITVTHSPMLLASMEPVFDPARDSLWVFDLVEMDGVQEVRIVKDAWHRRGDASMWLRSSIFDLKEARSIEAEAAITAAQTFMGRDVSEPVEFARIYEALRRSMPGDDPFWVDWRAWAWRRGLLSEEAR